MLNGYAYITLLVNNQDEAIQFFQEKLELEVRMDVPFGPDVRWVTVAPAGAAFPEISLVQAENDATKAAVGKQAGDTTAMVLTTDDVDAYHAKLKAKKVNVLGDPEDMPWGRQFALQDLYGNIINVLQPAQR